MHVEFTGTFCRVGEYDRSAKDRLARTSGLSTVIEVVGVELHNFRILKMHCPRARVSPGMLHSGTVVSTGAVPPKSKYLD